LPKSAVDVIGTAFEHTRHQLTQPFQFGQWARLALLALATGEISSGGGCNSFRRFGEMASKSPNRSLDFQSAGDVFSRLGIDMATLAAIIITAIIGLLILGLVFVYISSITRFMLFESVLRKHCDLGAGWDRWQRQGLLFFGWQLTLSVVSLAVAALLFVPLLLPVLGIMLKHQKPGPELLMAFLPMIFVFGAFALLMMLIAVLAKDFVVPLMAVENLGVMESWGRLLRWMRADPLSYVGYIVMKIVLAIAASVVFSILTIIVMVVLMIPFGIVVGAVIISAKAAGMTWNVFTITAAVVVGTVIVAALTYVVGFICVPVAVFFPAYAMYFFAERFPALYAVLYPTPPAAPPSLPPLSPASAPIG
jgi:hypothetical protein